MGMNLTKTVSNLFLGKNKMHGAFVDSCTHHCTSCSHAGEDSWNGERIKSTEEVTAATAFAVWYQKSFPLTVYSGANLTTGLSVSMPKSRMFLQDKPYPCDDCCICRLAKR